MDYIFYFFKREAVKENDYREQYIWFMSKRVEKNWHTKQLKIKNHHKQARVTL